MADERPKPRFGELAPEGWVWKPPAETGAADSGAGDDSQASRSGGATDAREQSRASVAPATPPGPAERPAPPRATDPRATAPGPTAGPTRGDGRTGDDSHAKPPSQANVIATVFLLILGLFATFNISGALLMLPESMQQAVELQGISVTYTAVGAANAIGVTGAVVQVVIYAVAVWLSVVALRARKTAFFIPLACAVLSLMALFLWIILALVADGGLMNALLQGPTAG